jgi:predicted GIY-YIG superfamily endonuclease
MYSVYILLNETKTRTYTGVADDVSKRLALHNAGRIKASRPYRPYKIFILNLSKRLKKLGKEKSSTNQRLDGAE